MSQPLSFLAASVEGRDQEAARLLADDPGIAARLLERGADPDDDESLYHSVYHRDHACLRLLLAHGARVNGTNALPAATGAGDVEVVRLLVDAGGDPGRRPAAPAAAGH